MILPVNWHLRRRETENLNYHDLRSAINIVVSQLRFCWVYCVAMGPWRERDSLGGVCVQCGFNLLTQFLICCQVCYYPKDSVWVNERFQLLGAYLFILDGLWPWKVGIIYAKSWLNPVSSGYTRVTWRGEVVLEDLNMHGPLIGQSRAGKVKLSYIVGPYQYLSFSVQGQSLEAGRLCWWKCWPICQCRYGGSQVTMGWVRSVMKRSCSGF